MVHRHNNFIWPSRNTCRPINLNSSIWIDFNLWSTRCHLLPSRIDAATCPVAVLTIYRYWRVGRIIIKFYDLWSFIQSSLNFNPCERSHSSDVMQHNLNALWLNVLKFVICGLLLRWLIINCTWRLKAWGLLEYSGSWVSWWLYILSLKHMIYKSFLLPKLSIQLVLLNKPHHLACKFWCTLMCHRVVLASKYLSDLNPTMSVAYIQVASIYPCYSYFYECLINSYFKFKF